MTRVILASIELFAAANRIKMQSTSSLVSLKSPHLLFFSGKKQKKRRKNSQSVLLATDHRFSETKLFNQPPV